LSKAEQPEQNHDKVLSIECSFLKHKKLKIKIGVGDEWLSICLTSAARSGLVIGRCKKSSDISGRSF
jgi:hypothetical protein